MKKSQYKAEIYYRTNHVNHLASLQYLKTYANKKELNPSIYTDLANGLGNRPALNDLFAMIHGREINMVIALSHAQLTRSRVGLAVVSHELDKSNVKLVLPHSEMEVADHG